MRIYINDNGIVPIQALTQGEKKDLLLEVYSDMSEAPTNVTLYAKLPNGDCKTLTAADIVFSNGYIRCRFNTEQLTQFKGTARCQVEYSAGANVIVSSTFVLSIKKSIREEFNL